MYIQCPKCLFSDNIDEAKIPEKGGFAKCPKCGERFPIKKSHNSSPAFDRFSESTVVIPAGSMGPSPHAAAHPSAHKLSFHGYGSTLFGIQVVNILLTIITLGIYHFWGKTKVRKYLYSETELKGERFAYHGTGKELFFGWLKAMVIVALGYGIIFGLSTYVHPLFVLLIYPVILVAIPFALVGAMRYRLSRTSWHGIRFSFRGSLLRAIRLYILGVFLMIVTLGIYAPFFHAQMRTFWSNESYFGTVPFNYSGRGKDLLGTYILTVILIILTLGLYAFWFKAKLQRYDWEHTSFSTARFKSTVSGMDLFALQLTNLLFLVFTLGIAYPWVVVRTLRFHYAFLAIEGEVDLNKIKQEIQSSKAMGEGFADFMNIDSGLI